MPEAAGTRAAPAHVLTRSSRPGRRSPPPAPCPSVRYIKLNRARLQRKGDGASVPDCLAALSALFEVLLLLSKLMAPLTPFLAEHIYRQLAVALPEAERQPSVHFCMMPEPDERARDADIERAVGAIIPVIELGRNIRLRRKKPLKVPLPELIVLHRDASFLQDVKSLERYVTTELNVRAVSVRRFVDSAELVGLRALPNHLELGKRFGKTYGAWQAKVKALSHEQLCAFLETKSLTIDGEVRADACRRAGAAWCPEEERGAEAGSGPRATRRALTPARLRARPPLAPPSPAPAGLWLGGRDCAVGLHRRHGRL